MSRLFVSLGSVPVLALEVGGGTIRLGRAAGNDIVLPLPEVADFHAEIVSAEASVSVRVLGDERLFVNGESATQAALCDGDLISLGSYRLRWLAADEPASTARPVSRITRSIEISPDSRRSDVRRLVVTSGKDAGTELRLEGPAMVVGRSPDCDLVLSDDAVSWRQCSVEITGTEVRLRDLGSRNGTFLDGTRIGSARATIGSRVRVGETTLEFGGPPAATEDEEVGLAELVGGSAVMRKVYARIRELSGSRVPVLISGETGTGKELVARAIHTLGPRSGGAFVPVNCAAIPRDIMEDELFGHVRGAFTGASTDRMGAFERAAAGTVLLDEIGELQPELQAKLLRVVEDGEIPRLGGGIAHGDFRLLTATNHDLERDLAAGRFRRDLYYRIAVERIDLPRLSERPEDIPNLVRAFLGSAEERWDVPTGPRVLLEPAALERLRRHSWPGNVRELRNVILRAVGRVRDGVVRPEMIEELLEAASPEPMASSLEEVEREAIRKALHDSNGQRRAAARRLGIAESTLYEKIRRYGLEQVGLPA